MSSYLDEARAEAERVLNSAGGSSAAVNVFHLLEDRGVDLLRAPFGEQAFDGLVAISKDRQLAVVNSSKNWGRQRFTAAHELAHLIFDAAPGLSIDDNIDRGRTVREKRANAFAAHLLMPETAVTFLIDKHGGVSPEAATHLAFHFEVSFNALLFHLENLGLLAKEKHSRYRQRMGGLAMQMGYRPAISAWEKEKAAYSFPRRYNALAVEAFRRGRIDLSRLSELLRADAEALDQWLREAGISAPPEEP